MTLKILLSLHNVIFFLLKTRQTVATPVTKFRSISAFAHAARAAAIISLRKPGRQVNSVYTLAFYFRDKEMWVLVFLFGCGIFLNWGRAMTDFPSRFDHLFLRFIGKIWLELQRSLVVHQKKKDP